jgi:hypothetical protein
MKSQLVKIGVLLFSSSLVVLFIIYQMGSFDRNRINPDFNFKGLKSKSSEYKKLITSIDSLKSDTIPSKKQKLSELYGYESLFDFGKDYYFEFDPTIIDSSDYKASIAKINERNSRLLDTNNRTIDSSEIAPIRFYSSKSGSFRLKTPVFKKK